MDIDYKICDTFFGPTRILCDVMQQAEMNGKIANFARYLKDAIVFTQSDANVYLFTVFIPQFSYYFKFQIHYDKDLHKYQLADFALFQPDFPPSREYTIDDNVVREMIKVELEPIVAEIRKIIKEKQQPQQEPPRKSDELDELLGDTNE